MLIFNEIKDNILPSSCLALGMFDGVHLGHKRVILDAVNKAKTMDAISTVVTFSNHPQEVITGKTPQLLTTPEQRLQFFEELGVQATFIIEFTKEIADYTAEEYLQKVLIKTLNPKNITVGYNHHFGANKEGNCDKLLQFSAKYGFDVSVIDPIKIETKTVSSSLIRKLIKNGNSLMASKMLGRPYSIKNKVIHGEQRGRKMGFPTANLVIPHNVIAPKAGVYSGFTTYNNRIYKSVINIGKRPTFNDLQTDLVEVHLIDFNCDIYGEEIEVFLYDRLRSEEKFESMEKLVEQIKVDYDKAKNTDLVI